MTWSHIFGFGNVGKGGSTWRFPKNKSSFVRYVIRIFGFGNVDKGGSTWNISEKNSFFRYVIRIFGFGNVDKGGSTWNISEKNSFFSLCYPYFRVWKCRQRGEYMKISQKFLYVIRKRIQLSDFPIKKTKSMIFQGKSVNGRLVLWLLVGDRLSTRALAK